MAAACSVQLNANRAICVAIRRHAVRPVREIELIGERFVEVEFSDGVHARADLGNPKFLHIIHTFESLKVRAKLITELEASRLRSTIRYFENDLAIKLYATLGWRGGDLLRVDSDVFSCIIEMADKDGGP